VLFVNELTAAVGALPGAKPVTTSAIAEIDGRCLRCAAWRGGSLHRSLPAPSRERRVRHELLAVGVRAA
jgi:hypothetical protein